MKLVGMVSSSHQRVFRGAVLAFFSIAAISIALVILSVILQGDSPGILLSPTNWLRGLDSSTAFDVISNGAELLAAILAIAITVVAIVVELAANRYSHRISSLFVREPINIVVLSFFVIATTQSIWIALTFNGAVDPSTVPNAGLLISMLMVTFSLIILLPYFAFVLSFLSPISIVEKIRHDTFRSIRLDDARSVERSKLNVEISVDELQDIARRAAELSDRAVAMTSINALTDLVLTYQDMLEDLPDSWFEVSEVVARDPDFVSLSKTSIREIESGGTWVDVKIMRQYLDLISDSNPSSRDITYLIAINTKRIGIGAIGTRPPLVELCIHCFNSYLRATINNQDQRTSYYIMNQYRQLADALLRHGDEEVVREIALHLQFYGLLGFKANIPFLLEVAAYDLMHLIKQSVLIDSAVVDDLLKLLLELDQEIKEEFQEDSLLGVRRSQIQLAAFLLEHGDEERVRRICRDMTGEKPHRLDYLRQLFLSENRPQYWEFTDRGVNFSYLEPQLRPHLETIFDWIA